jgi:hypothetical protein
METTVRNKTTAPDTIHKKAPITFGLCKARHILSILSLVIITAYFLMRENKGLMASISKALVQPYHRLAGRITSVVDFSVAEFLYLIVILAVLIYIIRAVILLIKRGERLKRAYLTAVTLITAALVIYAGVCLLWGVYYYSGTFSGENGIDSDMISVEQLKTVTYWFAGLANSYSLEIPHDKEGLADFDIDEIFDKAETLYAQAEDTFPALKGPELRPKPMVFSYFMSYINFTGFFFPFTGEANVNVHSPDCLIPATVAHELAHQRGVAQEDEANFVAVMACMENGDPEYCYSAALLAYIHLGNALYSADKPSWENVYSTLNDWVRADLRANNEYWDGFETKAAKASEAVYDNFLKSYGQELGMKSYGACVDLLVGYYYEDALDLSDTD